jgi:hypothetical protein
VENAVLLKGIYRFNLIPNVILHRNRKINTKIHKEACKTLNSKSNPEHKEQSWGYHNAGFQIMLQNHSNKNSILLTQKTDTKTNGTE